MTIIHEVLYLSIVMGLECIAALLEWLTPVQLMQDINVNYQGSIYALSTRLVIVTLSEHLFLADG